MNTNTPFFRVALTIALLWIASFGYNVFTSYQGAYQSTEYIGYSIPDYLTEECFASKIDFEAENWRDREPTNVEISSCLTTARASHRRSVEASNEFAFKRAKTNILLWGLLPAIGLLLVAAFWSKIATGISRVIRGYLNWLRFGSKIPSEVENEI